MSCHPGGEEPACCEFFFFFNIPMKIMNGFRDGKDTGYTNNIRIIDLNEYVSMVFICIYIYVNIDMLIFVWI